MKKQDSDDKNLAAILINMGGPENQDGVRPFLFRLFSDRHVMDIPQPLRAVMALMISAFRAQKVKRRYQQIGGGSPLMKWTALQARGAEKYLREKYSQARVGVAYSYVQPSIENVIAKFASEGFERIVALPLYPHYSFSTLGSIFGELEKARKKYSLGDRLIICAPFYKDERYIGFSASLLTEALRKIDPAKPYKIVFSAHSLPESFILNGDPYKLQVARNAMLLASKAGIGDYILSFQSKVGPVEWIKPSTVETIRDLGHLGIKQVVVAPIGFVSDNIETLHELDIELAEIAHRSGIECFIRAGVFNDDDGFARFLADYITEAIS
jgi:ferrochelatase